MNKTITRVLVGLSAPLMLGAAAAAAERPPEDRSADPTATCARMMQDAGATEQGKKAMQEFMQSPRAPEAMTTMMARARQMGEGDVMLGMTRMMEMMGPMGGGMMGAPRGTMPPRGHQPGK